MKKERKTGMSDMISSNTSAPANLPQTVIHKYYPKNNYVNNYYLDDSYKGIDKQTSNSVKKIRRNESDSMY
jgi:hypothetical protein